MKLYIYDHCPFCVRARMIFGLRDVAVEEVVLLNDDEATPIALIGAKQVPILQKSDGSHMGESLDIVRYINELSGNAPLAAARDEIKAWCEQVGKYYNRLIMPRDVKLNLAEFATPESIQYFIDKKEKSMGSFQAHWNLTAVYLSKIHMDLNDLAGLAQSADYLNGQSLSWEDILVFPMLRNLTMVRGLVLPDILLNYVNQMSAQSGIDLYFDRAL